MGSTSMQTHSTLGVEGFALVTGGASGIGRCTSLLLAREYCRGIALADFNATNLAKVKVELEAAATNPDFRCITVIVDVSEEDSVRNMIATVVQEFGRIDFAANIAGIGAVKGPIAEGKLNDWNKMIAVNLTGVWLCAKEEILQMMKQEPRQSSRTYEKLQRGSIVNIASLAGVAGLHHSGAYTAAKHGVVGVTRTSSIDHPEVKSNAVVPGYIQTPLTSVPGAMRDGALKKVNDWTPMKRFGRPEEVAESVVWLLGDRSNFSHGSCLTIDGGYMAQ